MKVSLNWVKEFTDVKLPVPELVEKIGAQLGAVEEVIDLGKKYQGIVVAKVMSCEKHPDADKLHICTIDDGGITPDVKREKDGYVRIVCGAPEVRAGMLVAWLPPGSVVPNTYNKDPFTLEAREIRGEISYGMLGTPRELAVSDDHSGLLVVDEGVKPGTAFAEVYGLNDYIIDIENKMFTHRPDLFGIMGVAREIAGIGHDKFTSPDWYRASNLKPQTSNLKKLPLKVTNDVPELSPRVMAVAIDGITIAPSPLWMQAVLTRVGIRPINNIVDITNYMMHLTSQPMHAFDYVKIKERSGSTPTIGPRLAREGEDLILLGGKKLKLTKKDMVLATDKQAVDLAGVMGGANTEVDQNTTSIILTVCSFDMYAIRRSCMRHGVFTDAATRYTKNQSPLQNDRVLAKAMVMINEYAKSYQASEVFDLNDGVRSPIAVHVTDEFINTRLGLKLSIKEMARLLENVEFDIAINGPTLVVTPPFWRTDIEIPEDIVEEIGRLYGYDHLPLELPKRDLTPSKQQPLVELRAQIREILVSAGANELLTYSFVHGNLLDKVGQNRENAFQLSNALSPELQYYRLSLTPSLLDKVHPNVKAGHGKFVMFELGKVHNKLAKDAEKLPAEMNRLAAVLTADTKQETAKGGAPYFAVQKYLTTLLDKLGIDSFKLAPGLPTNDGVLGAWAAPYQPERSAMILADVQGHPDTLLGFMGEFKQSVTKALKLPFYTAGFELDISILMALSAEADTSRYMTLSKFPKVEQDICLKVNSHMTYRELCDFVKATAETLKPVDTRIALSPIDIFQRADDQKHKQLTFRLSITANDRTLTDEAVHKLLDEVAVAANQKFSAVRI